MINNEIMLQIKELFTPSAPVLQSKLFVGRKNQIHRINDAIYDIGKHIILYGERGVGKTSIANYIKDIQSQNIRVIHCFADWNDNFDAIWKKLFSEFTFITTKSNAGFVQNETHTMQNLKSFIPERDIAENDISNLFQKLNIPIIIIIDEFDKIKDNHTKEKMAHIMKLLSDKGLDITILIVGVASDINELITGHESIKRNIVEIQMPRMNNDELNDILSDRLNAMNFTIDDNVKESIIKLSCGLPQYIHTIGREVCISASEDTRNHINQDDMKKGLSKTIENAEQSLKDTYKKAIESNRDTIYKDVLLACAKAEKDNEGYFTQKSIVEPLERILNRKIPIAGFQTHIAKFLTQERGNILEKIGKSRAYKYRFTEPRMQIYIDMMDFVYLMKN
jgi:Cdc6-like AAA superfamily ATPase